MGIGVQALLLMRYLSEDGYLAGMSSVIELGSQQFAPSLSAARLALAELFPTMDVGKVGMPKDFYRALGLETYRCIDLDGANDALVFNLNKSLAQDYLFNETFDLVTNHGTTEHAFDQSRCFENVHNLTKPGGIIIHALPSQGYQNHSFFNYHPSFFLDLAAANNYEVLALYYNLGEYLFPYTDSFLDEQRVAATQQVAVFAVLRKRSDEPFVLPFDGRYYFEQQGHEFVPRTDVGGHSRVEFNQFPLSSKHFSVLLGAQKIMRRPVVKIVVPVWGRQFTNSFLNFSLKSQITSRLIEFGERDDIEYTIVTDSGAAALINRSEFLSPLKNTCRLNILVADNLVGLPSYRRLTESYNVALSGAVKDDLYIFITSDCFFSREVFKRIKEKAERYRVILSPALRVADETFYSDVVLSDAYDVDGRGALAIAMRNEHPLTEAFCINNSRKLIHPLPAQTMYRVQDGYVGRWNVMHPIAVRIANSQQRISQTIDWNYSLYHIRNWADVGVLDSIDDGLTVSLTPLDYTQGEPFSRGSSRRARLSNLKSWVNISWALNFHIAQINSPIRLLTTNSSDKSDVIEGERQVAAIVDKFTDYVSSRNISPSPDYKNLTANELFRVALERPQLSRQWPRRLREGSNKAKSKLWPLMRSRLVRFLQVR